MVESFNKKLKQKILTKYLFQTIIEMNDKLIEYVNDYNMNIRLKSLNYKTPFQYLKEEKDIIIQRIVI
jgi:ribonucleotide reductase beta subunit family protein with ferritin-like domain